MRFIKLLSILLATKHTKSTKISGHLIIKYNRSMKTSHVYYFRFKGTYREFRLEKSQIIIQLKKL